ncbi:MAG: thioredoxin domain-containing protein [Chloroflexi bacterium]|nr:thioredoxin domain-containing protein [Chloroflexota bacterium]|tara:strand:+ start:14036 stop:16081 length:2046 start_codon:yes stop_codon:yes gene_type:complete
MPNKLINESSPYLLQHAHNPVNWFPWGEEALNLSKNENKPIFLSIGYSACHWCHVMEKESFVNKEVAEILNNNFISIKVDREERPDIDSIYMNAVQNMGINGGWPLTVFLTPECIPFYAGTYFPTLDRHGMPGFLRIIESIKNIYNSDIDKIQSIAKQVAEHLEHEHKEKNISNKYIINEEILHKAFEKLKFNFDDKNGGFGTFPKFPQAMIYEFLLQYYYNYENIEALEMVEHTLLKIANGGIFDQIGGGFHRYSTDEKWIIPHFEKMLYDNALLVKLYLHLYQISPNPLFKDIIHKTLDFIETEMLDKNGGFYSSIDADTNHKEGEYFVWNKEELKNIFNKEEFNLICTFFGITDNGNFEGNNVLYLPMDKQDFLKKYTIDSSKIEILIKRLFNIRNKRTKPNLDTKILTSWNGLMLGAFAEAGAILNDNHYLNIANLNAKYIINIFNENGMLLRDNTSKNPSRGFLEDYAYFIDGLLTLHESNLDEEILNSAIKITEEMKKLFWDDATNTLYDTSLYHEKLIKRPRDIYDNAIPSANSVAALILIKLSIITNNDLYKIMSDKLIHSSINQMINFPNASGNWLCNVNYYLSKIKEIVIIGDPKNNELMELKFQIHKNFIPNKIIVGGNINKKLNNKQELLIFQNRTTLNNKPTIYICENYQCNLPITTKEELMNQLIND